MLPRLNTRQPENVLSHWFVLVDAFQFSAVEFYDRLQAELVARRVPRLKTRRVEYHEGSVLSDKRLYLRLSRERFSFEVCAAPFGSCYFFSLRFVELPRGGWFQFLLLMLGLAFAAAGLWLLGDYALYHAERWFWWAVMLLLSGGLAASARRYARRRVAEREDPPPAMPDFDAFLLGLPVIGAWYERIRKDTFHRYDSRLMYHTLVSEIVKHLVEDVTSAKGVRLLETYEYSPILGELYKRQRVPAREPEPAIV